MDVLNSGIYAAEDGVKSERNTQAVLHRDKAVNTEETLSYMEGIMSNIYNLSSRKGR